MRPSTAAPQLSGSAAAPGGAPVMVAAPENAAALRHTAAGGQAVPNA